MAIFVKAHRRGKSVIKAYTRGVGSTKFGVTKKKYGGAAIKDHMNDLKYAGIKARRTSSVYENLAGIEVIGTKTQRRKAAKILGFKYL